MALSFEDKGSVLDSRRGRALSLKAALFEGDISVPR
jgi:hypothetical protein